MTHQLASSYRLYLLNTLAQITAADWFTAADDDEAASIGSVIFTHSSDICSGYEVWRGGVPVIKAPTGQPFDIRQLNDEIMNRRQKNIVDLEERLSNSWDCLKRSRKLLAVMSKLEAQTLDVDSDRTWPS